MVRANGSYPLCPGFKSLHRHHPLLGKFLNFLKRFPLETGSRILLAYSGGGDSAGMVALFLSIKPKFKFDLGLCHINHKLRGKESDRDEKFCKEMALRLGLKFYSYKVRSKPKRGDSIEEWARVNRYKLLEKCREKYGYDFIATAHSLDDQAETILMRLGRGTGIEGLKGIEFTLEKIIRPCLILKSKELKEIAKECNIEYVEDSSNREKRFLRNKVRFEVMPVIEKIFPSIKENIFKLSLIVSNQDCKIPSIAKVEGNSLYYPLRVFSSMTLSDAINSFRLGIKMLKGDLKGFKKEHFEAIAKLITSKSGAFVPLPKSLSAFREDEGIRIKKKRIGAVR